jgi:TrpR family transcriptional regulator, trp operon repressor
MKTDKLIKARGSTQQAFKQELCRLVTKISSPNLADRFLSDLLSPAEYNELALRWQIIKLLHKGLSIREVAYRLGVALATVERGSRELKYSKQQGFQELLKNYN